MYFSTANNIAADDEVDKYEMEGIRCVMDNKSVLYLYRLELDYLEELIGEESCGCSSTRGGRAKTI